MSEPVEVKIARLEEIIKALVARIESNHVEAESHRKATDQTLASLVVVTNQWAGVRATLSVIGLIVATLSACAGAAATYLFHK